MLKKCLHVERQWITWTSTFDALCAVNAHVLFHAIVYPVKNKTLRERSLQVNIEPFIELDFFLSRASLFCRVLRKMSA